MIRGLEQDHNRIQSNCKQRHGRHHRQGLQKVGEQGRVEEPFHGFQIERRVLGRALYQRQWRDACIISVLVLFVPAGVRWWCS